MRNDQIFVLLLVVLLPMSGCFDGGGVGEAEGAQDSDGTSGTTIVNHYYNNTTTIQTSQEKIWYTSGGSYFSQWNDPNSTSDGRYCSEWRNTYSSTDGSLVNTYCEQYEQYSDFMVDGNTSECISRGGTLTSYNSYYGYNYSSYDSYAPVCKIEFATISAPAGSALLLYEAHGVSTAYECNGLSVSFSYSTSLGAYGKEYVLSPGSALDCNLTLYKVLTYGESDLESIWSIVYAIQDTTVV
jgi:hypothetical protein